MKNIEKVIKRNDFLLEEFKNIKPFLNLEYCIKNLEKELNLIDISITTIKYSFHCSNIEKELTFLQLRALQIYLLRELIRNEVI
jgi:hypothetical protein